MLDSLYSKHHVLNHSFRYLVGGAAIFAVDLLVFLAISHLVPEKIVLANVVSKISGAFFGFFVHKYWTFSWKKSQSAGHQIGGYIGLLAFNLILSSALIYFLVTSLEMPIIVGKLISDVIVIVTAFLLSRNLVFKGVVEDDIQS